MGVAGSRPSGSRKREQNYKFSHTGMLLERNPGGQLYHTRTTIITTRQPRRAADLSEGPIGFDAVRRSHLEVGVVKNVEQVGAEGERNALRDAEAFRETGVKIDQSRPVVRIARRGSEHTRE